jgi:hypothetical protein
MPMNKTLGALTVLLVLGGCLCFGQACGVREGGPVQASPKSVAGIVREFMGVPYQRGPLGEGEGERIYREDVFDCTTFVLTVAARINAIDSTPRAAMTRIHYHPPGEVSYRNRLHFSSYRNKVSPYFEDITAEVGGVAVKRADVLLNRDHPRQGRLISLDWEREVTIEYIPSKRVPKVLDELPPVAGAGFVRREYFPLGLGVAHEGLVLKGSDLAHASSEQGEVVREDFLGYLERNDYTGVLFFRITNPKTSQGKG